MNEGSIYRVETIDNTPVAVPYANLSFGGAELQAYTYDTDATEPFKPHRSGDVCVSHLLTYGNISFMCIRYIFKSAFTLSKDNVFTICEADIYDEVLTVSEFEKYLCAHHNHVSRAGSGAVSVTEIIGVPKFNGNPLADRIIVGDSDDVTILQNRTVDTMYKRYSFKALEDISLSANDILEFEHIFMNSIGLYSDCIFQQ